MADVEIPPQQPETLTAVEKEEAAEASEGAPPQGDDAAAARDSSHQNAAAQDVSEPERDRPEGSGDAGEELPPTRPPPEGLQQDSPKPEDSPATGGGGGGEGEAGPQPPETSEAKPGESENNTTAVEPPEASQAEEKDSAEKEERKAGDGQGTERTGEGTERGQDTERGADDNLAPPTPTFSSDHDDQDADDINRQQAEETLAAETRAEAAEAADTTPAMVTPSGGLPTTKRLTNTPLEGAGMPLKPLTAQLPPVARGQVRGQQMTSAISDALKHGARPSPKQLIRARRPPKYIRLATVTVSPARARQLPQGPSLYYEEPRRPRKVITWDEATSARPPLRIDMEGPTPCTYTPRVKPLHETNAPAYTFGSKCQPEKAGGARTAWTKSWFQTPHVWQNKVDFTRDSNWPSPNHYPKGSSLGPRQRTMPEAPSFTFGHKMAYSIVKPGAPKEPSPNEYKRQLADRLVLKRGPSFTHQMRREGTVLWGASEVTPGPAAYTPNKQGVDRPSFTIQGIRREKSHVLGPYSSL